MLSLAIGWGNPILTFNFSLLFPSQRSGEPRTGSLSLSIFLYCFTKTSIISNSSSSHVSFNFSLLFLEVRDPHHATSVADYFQFFSIVSHTIFGLPLAKTSIIAFNFSLLFQGFRHTHSFCYNSNLSIFLYCFWDAEDESLAPVVNLSIFLYCFALESQKIEEAENLAFNFSLLFHIAIPAEVSIY